MVTTSSRKNINVSEETHSVIKQRKREAESLLATDLTLDDYIGLRIGVWRMEDVAPEADLTREEVLRRVADE